MIGQSGGGGFIGMSPAVLDGVVDRQTFGADALTEVAAVCVGRMLFYLPDRFEDLDLLLGFLFGLFVGGVDHVYTVTHLFE